ncbi:MAG: FtsQ-type POTRA domain-containing protein [Desulfatiglandaceae bacterium]
MKRRFAVKNSPSKRKKKKVVALFRVMRHLGGGILKIFLLFAVVAGISAVFLIFYHYLTVSPYLKLETVEMEGVDAAMRKELIQTAGLNSELSLLSLNLNAVREKMKKHPWVRSVKLERRFPNTLIVRAEKENAWALVLMENKIYYMNGWGDVFKEVEDSEDIDFPVITGASNQGSEIRKQLKQAAGVMRILRAEEGSWSLGELSEIHVQEGTGMSLYFNRLSAEIKIRSENPARRIEKLKKVAKHLAQTGRMDEVTRIDLNRVDGAVVSFKNG